MKTATLLMAASLALSSGALAQQTGQVRGEAAAQSRTSVSADRQGAQVQQQNEASAAAASRGASANAGGATEMNATLERPVDARRAKEGDEVRATLTEEARSESGVVMEQGATLVGRVTSARPHRRAARSGEGGAESALGIVFDKAILADGREVPINGTVQALAAAQSSTRANLQHADSTMAGARPAASRSGAARGSVGGGGLTGGVGAVAGGAVSTAGGVVGGTGSAAGRAGSTVGAATQTGGRIAGGAATQAGGRVTGGAAGSATGVVGASAGAIGGLDAAGRLASGSRGTFGLDGLEIASAASGGAQGSLITSASRNVRLDAGTRMLLVASGGAGVAR